MIIEKIAADITDDHEKYNTAIRAASKAGDKAVLVIHMAQTHFGERDLSAPEVTRILKNKFAIAVKDSAVHMALQRAANLKKSQLVAPTPREGITYYWLTQDGQDFSARSLSGDEK